MTAPSTRRILSASLIGTSIEFYDFYAYATAAALVFGKLFFPSISATAGQLAAFATLGVAFVARPLGSIFFGHFGDRIGRKSTLVASLLTMGVSTTLVAVLPTYAAIGWPAAALLCLLRFGQGFGLGGEWGGAALLAVEHAPPGWKARYGMFPQLGVAVGFLLANGLFLALSLGLSPADFQSWGWRVPFGLSALLVIVGLWIRLRLTETPEFAAVLEQGPPPAMPFGEVLRDHGGTVLVGMMGVLICFVLYYVCTAFALSYGTKVLGYTLPQFLALELGAIVFQGVGTLAAGYAADAHWDARRVLLATAATAVVTSLLMGPMMEAGSPLLIFLFLALSLFLMGASFGPVGAWLPSLFPARVRYTGASIALTGSGVIGGSLTPYAAQALSGHGLTPVGLLMSGAALVSMVGLVLAKGRATH